MLSQCIRGTLISMALCCAGACYANEASAPVKPPAIAASSAILVDALSGQVLYAKNPDVKRPPASTTKIMTAILLIENVTPDTWITAGKNAFDTSGSSLYLQPGERITAHDLLYGLMLRSANDGCVAVAEHVAGSETAFVQMMNKKAAEIGASNTSFDNCNGLNNPRHLTTARDLSIMARYAMRYPEFMDATRTKYYKITSRTIDTKDVVLTNHARFLWKFAGADGVKTGFTVPAGHCFVGGATVKGWRLISVVLNSPDVVQETTQLMKYGFHMYEPHLLVRRGDSRWNAPVAGGQTDGVAVTADAPIQYVTRRRTALGAVELRPRFDELRAPVAAGKPVGVLDAYVDGKKVGSAPLVTTTAVAKAKPIQVLAGFLRNWWFLSALMGVVAIRVVIGYGTTITKITRRGRRRIASRLRDLDPRG